MGDSNVLDNLGSVTHRPLGPPLAHSWPCAHLLPYVSLCAKLLALAWEESDSSPSVHRASGYMNPTLCTRHTAPWYTNIIAKAVSPLLVWCVTSGVNTFLQQINNDTLRCACRDISLGAHPGYGMKNDDRPFDSHLIHSFTLWRNLAKASPWWVNNACWKSYFHGGTFNLIPLFQEKKLQWQMGCEHSLGGCGSHQVQSRLEVLTQCVPGHWFNHLHWLSQWLRGSHFSLWRQWEAVKAEERK